MDNITPFPKPKSTEATAEWVDETVQRGMAMARERIRLFALDGDSFRAGLALMISAWVNHLPGSPDLDIKQLVSTVNSVFLMLDETLNPDLSLDRQTIALPWKHLDRYVAMANLAVLQAKERPEYLSWAAPVSDALAKTLAETSPDSAGVVRTPRAALEALAGTLELTAAIIAERPARDFEGEPSGDTRAERALRLTESSEDIRLLLR